VLLRDVIELSGKNSFWSRQKAAWFADDPAIKAALHANDIISPRIIQFCSGILFTVLPIAIPILCAAPISIAPIMALLVLIGLALLLKSIFKTTYEFREVQDSEIARLTPSVC